MGDEENQAEAKKLPAPHKRRKHKSTGLLTVLLLTVLVLAAGGWYGYHYLTGYQSRLNLLTVEQSKLQQQNSSLKAEFDSKWAILKRQQDDLADHINTLREKNQYLRKDWLLLEAEYLIQLAVQRLLFERDINTAIAALHAADTRLRDTGDPGAIQVRKAISESVQALKQVPQADLAGLSLTMSTINQEIEKLPLATPDPKSKLQNQSQEMTESRKVKSWRELPAAIWRDLKNLIIIRDHEKPVQPLLSPEQRFFLVENLRLQIEQARLAMLTGQQRVYKERIDTARHWIERHFDTQSPVTQATAATLQQLATAAIAPELPDISTVYQVLQKYRGANDKPPLAPVKEKTGPVQDK